MDFSKSFKKSVLNRMKSKVYDLERLREKITSIKNKVHRLKKICYFMLF